MWLFRETSHKPANSLSCSHGYEVLSHLIPSLLFFYLLTLELSVSLDLQLLHLSISFLSSLFKVFLHQNCVTSLFSVRRHLLFYTSCSYCAQSLYWSPYILSFLSAFPPSTSPSLYLPLFWPFFSSHNLYPAIYLCSITVQIPCNVFKGRDRHPAMSPAPARMWC